MNFKSKIKEFFIGTIFLIATIAPGSAHNVESDGNVGATFHIEPNHNPRAGEPNQAWFALTHKGGEIIPLEECDCQLAVYSQADKTKDAPILTPALKPISAEKYRGIPGAEIVFPKEGIYLLTLSGKPKDGKDFQPFELTYTVTASPGQANRAEQPTTAATPEASPPAQTDRSNNNQRWGSLITASIGAIIGIAAAVSLLKRKGQSQEESNRLSSENGFDRENSQDE